MKVKVKLFALLGRHLPAGTIDNETTVDVADGATAAQVMARLNLPPEEGHLVLLNGTYMQPPDRESHPLQPNDVLAIWPPIAGG